MANLKDLREKRGQLLHQARQMLDTAEAEKRSMTEDEKAKYDKIWNDQADLAEQIQREEDLVEAERRAAETRAEKAEQQGKKDPTEEERATLQMAGFRSFLRSGRVDGEGADEFRALQADSDTQGGFLVTPQQFVMELIKFVDNMVFIRQRARTFSIPTAASLGAPSLDTDPDDADWTVELGTGNEDSSMEFGKRELTPHPVAKRIKLANKLIRQVASVDTLVLQRLAYKFGITEEKAFLTGNGSGQPLGVFTASAQGISTSRDVSTDNTATSVTFDGLKNAKYSIKGQYHANAAWMFHRDAVKQISKLKDGEGQYLWQPSVVAGDPDRILNMPLQMSEYVPNTFTTGQYVGILGDFSNYWIADALDMQIQRLNELYAETNQTGFIGRKETDGMPVLEEAFARIKLG